MRQLFTVLTASLMLAGPVAAAEAPSAATSKAQAALKKTLPFEDRQDFDFATRGGVGSLARPRGGPPCRQPGRPWTRRA